MSSSFISQILQPDCDLIPEQEKVNFHRLRLKRLYEGIFPLIISSVLYTSIISLLSGTWYNLQAREYWILLVWGIALLQSVDAFFYFRADQEKINHQQYLRRFSTGIVLSAISWALLFWNISPSENAALQSFFILIALGITTFAAIFLSYHPRVFFLYQTIILVSIELQIYLHSHDTTIQLLFLVPTIYLFQLYLASSINQKFCNNIQLSLKNREKENLYKNLQFAIDQHAIVSITDTQGNIIYANDRMSKITQYSNQELLGQNHRIVKSDEFSDAFWKEMWKTIYKGNVWHHEIRNIAKDKSSYWVDTTIVPFMDDQGKPYQYISIRTDITHLKKLEEESIKAKNDALIRANISEILQGQKPLKQRIADALLALSNAADLHIQNKLGVFLLPEGGSELEMFVTHGQYTEEFLHKEKCVKLGSCLCGRAAISGELIISDDCFTDPDHDHTFENMQPHGHYIIPLEYNRKILGILFIYTDPYPARDQSRLDTLTIIGSLFGLAIANERIKEKMHQARKNAEAMAQAKSDFLANMSHEIRTPMNGVLGMLELLNDLELNEQARNYVETAHSSASLLLNVINDILDISKIESGKLHIEKINFDLRKTVENIAELLAKPAHQKNLELSCFIPPEIKTNLKGDVMRVQQVLSNLLSNAIKFTHEGEVHIAVSTVAETADEVTLRFEVQDTGIGIPEEKHSLLFQDFTQADTSTSRKYGGTGLGLAISKKLVELMGGQIGLQSQVGKGSTFWFELPFSLVQSDEDTAFDLRGLRILVIDDNETNCLILKKYLDNWGADAVTVQVPEIGLYRLQEAIEENKAFDILLLDMQMPDVSGYEIAAKIRHNPAYNALKIIILSSISLDQKSPSQQYFDLMLNKPIKQALLHDAIATVQNRVSAQNNTNTTNSEIKKLSGHVLFVDDNPVNQQLGCAMLKKAGLSYQVVNNGQEALNARKNESYDLILMDCQMPVMDGYEASRQIRLYEQQTATQKITIIALTANAMEQDRQKCLAAGMDDYLSKPYNFKGLYSVLAHWLNPEEAGDGQPEPVSESNTHQINILDENTDSPVIDEEKFNETREMMGDSLAMIIDAFIESGKDNLAAMEEHVEKQDSAGLGKSAHALKGSCAILGMQRLFDSCKQTEESCREHHIDNMEQHVARIRQHFEDSLKAMQTFLAEENNE